MFILLQRLLPLHFISRLVGWFANCEIGFIKSTFIKVIVWKYKVNILEASESDLARYKSFNQFFARQLKEGARSIEGKLCSPADGFVSAAGRIIDQQLIQAKGIDYSLGKLLAQDDISAYKKGSFITIYLSPKDYHRVHCPQDATLVSATYVPGKLFSVNQTTTEGVRDLFADNERLVMEFDTSNGKMSVVMVGALIVAAIQPAWRDKPYQAKQAINETFDSPIFFKQGAELGLFQMGSTAIIVTEEELDWQLHPADAVKMGNAIVG
ncbi:MAG: phosphatidylserine decarboxylase [Candidatus Azotimanducaceae bacterium]